MPRTMTGSDQAAPAARARREPDEDRGTGAEAAVWVVPAAGADVMMEGTDVSRLGNGRVFRAEATLAVTRHSTQQDLRNARR